MIKETEGVGKFILFNYSACVTRISHVSYVSDKLAVAIMDFHKVTDMEGHCNWTHSEVICWMRSLGLSDGCVEFFDKGMPTIDGSFLPCIDFKYWRELVYSSRGSIEDDDSSMMLSMLVINKILLSSDNKSMNSKEMVKLKKQVDFFPSRRVSVVVHMNAADVDRDFTNIVQEATKTAMQSCVTSTCVTSTSHKRIYGEIDDQSEFDKQQKRQVLAAAAEKRASGRV
jgi:hypothetical protein